MRICYFADGRYIHALRWMKFFAAKGHQMHLISFAEVPSEQIQQIHDAGITYHGSVGNLHLKRFWLTLRDVRFIRSVLKKEKIDVLHTHFLGTNVIFGALSGFHPHVVTVMGGDVIGDNWKPSGSFQVTSLLPYGLRKADAFTAWSRRLAEKVKPYVRPGIDIEVIHGGVELDKFQSGPAPSELRRILEIPADAKIVFSPRLIRRLYNIETVARAAGTICEQLPDTYFLMALPAHILDDEYVEEVKKIFSDNGTAANVRFLETIRHDEIADYYRLADVTVSIPDTDGTPMAVLESMACGTPTVIGNLPDYDKHYFQHEETTLMADVKDPSSVASAILRILNDDELTERIVSESLRRVKETGGYAYQMNKMEQIYLKLVAK